MRDKGVVEAFEYVPHKLDYLICSWSRVFCDVERFPEQEFMEKVGMGYYYTHCDDGGILRIEDRKLRDSVRHFYDEHHAELFRRSWRKIVDYGQCIILDAHSFPDKPFEYEERLCLPRRGRYWNDSPEINIGTAYDGQTPDFLKDHFLSHFKRYGFRCGLNFPFEGSIVPQGLNNDPRLSSIMIEINQNVVHEWRLKTAIAELFKFKNLPATTR
jgi:N-formylglutamate amidohydrolase